MQIIEYRITLPLTLDEYQVAQLYTIEESLQTETNGGKIVVLNNEHFDDYPLLSNHKFSSGVYTSKVYQWSAKLPKILRNIFPLDSMDLNEEAWDAYPYCRTIISSPMYRKERFYVKIESLHVANDRGQLPNVHELPPDLLQQRKVVYIDIAHDVISPKDYKPEEDPRKFHSLKTKRGPLLDTKWRNTCEPVMTCYKLVTCELKTFGLQNILETFLQSFERRIFTNFHRQLFCSIDRWHGLTLGDVRGTNNHKKEDKEYDKEKKLKLKEIVKTKAVN
ncbi:hypothetical protein DOY81_009993 [Sarcophaga bullata]|nr:hypothetical protein DOY81_009993 [Sarcophaga bullata]